MTAQTHPPDHLPSILFALTVVTGVVDAVSFLALGHVFTANMTGNVVFMAFAAAGAPGLSLARSALALVAFLAGATIGGRLAGTGTAKPGSRWPATPFLLEAALLLAAAFPALGVDRPEGAVAAWLVIALTGLAMGIRNATVRKLGIPDMTTTVLTLTLTGIAADSSLAGGKNPRWRTRAAAVLLMFAGAAIGALAVSHSLFVALAACSVVVAAGGLVILRRAAPSASS
jgi:uncharacterized membrane protein YoaK (UPF0700 family)